MSPSRASRVAAVLLVTGTVAGVLLLALRGVIVPVTGFQERQWSLETGELLREERTRWARVVGPRDATLAGRGVHVEWSGTFVARESAEFGIVLESGGDAEVALDGEALARVPGERPDRGRGMRRVEAGAHELVVRAAVPEDGGRFRAMVRMPDGRTVPLEDAPVFADAVTPAQAELAEAFRAWADPALAACALIALAGLAGVLRAGAPALGGGETALAVGPAALAGTACGLVVMAVALAMPHGAGLRTWGTFLWNGVPAAARFALIAAGLVPWLLALRGRAPRVPHVHPAVAGVGAFALLWLLREGRFWGDAWTTLALLEGRAEVGPFGPFFWKEPLDRLIAVLAVRIASALGAGAADAVAFTSCLAGAGLAALTAAHVRRFPEDSLPAALALTAGASLVFFGHVENYAWASAAVVAFLLLAPRTAAGTTGAGRAGLVGGLAVAFHPIAIGAVAPAAVVAALSLRARPPAAARLLAGVAAVPLALVAACLAAGIDPPRLGANAFADDPSVWLSPAHAFSPAHLATLANRLAVLLSPGIAVGLAAALARSGAGVPAAPRPWLAAAAGSALFLVFLHGKIRPPAYDWDLWAPVAFPWALLAGHALRHPRDAALRAWAWGVSAAVLLAGAWGNRAG